MPGAGALMKSTKLGFATHAMGFAANVAGEKIGGASMGDSIVRGAMWTAAEALIPGASWIPMIAGVGKFAGEAYMDHKLYGQSKIQKYYQAGFGGNFQDTQQAYTMRQRGVQQMQQSKLNARNVLGSEARTFHKSYY